MAIVQMLLQFTLKLAEMMVRFCLTIFLEVFKLIIKGVAAMFATPKQRRRRWHNPRR